MLVNVAMADQPDKIDAIFAAQPDLAVLIHALPVVTRYIESLNLSLKAEPGIWTLSRCQKGWLRMVLMGILVTGTFNGHGFPAGNDRRFKLSSAR